MKKRLQQAWLAIFGYPSPLDEMAKTFKRSCAQTAREFPEYASLALKEKRFLRFQLECDMVTAIQAASKQAERKLACGANLQEVLHAYN